MSQTTPVPFSCRIAEEHKFNGQQLERVIRKTVDVHAEAGGDIVSPCFSEFVR